MLSPPRETAKRRREKRVKELMISNKDPPDDAAVSSRPERAAK
jgi:hypothetical protein